MRWWSPVATALVLVTALPASAAALPSSPQDAGFPHRDHEGLFPLCSGCHQRSAEAPGGITLPAADSCVRCHDGATRERVEWRGRAPRPSNLRFSHAEHPGVSERVDTAGCAACHAEPGTSSRMAVTAARPARCLSCHEHRAPAHLAEEASCRQCHVPLTRAPALPSARIADFPRPDSHEASGWVLEHGEGIGGSAATCSVCHAQESCRRCHLNGEAVAPIRSLGRDARVAELARSLDPEYPEPPSHRTGAWRWEHGPAARADGASSCANCHRRATCESCHLGGLDETLAALPEPPPHDPRGLKEVSDPGEVHGPGFATRHKIEASTVPGTCDSCHRRSSFCVSCHEGSGDPGFHLDNFMVQHAAEAYGNESECASCHNPDLFCRSCHEGAGLASRGRLDAGFHNARPFWLLEHGEGARKGLESCATCHAQNDCAQCHSARGGWRVSPHGPDFDARRMRDQAPLMCLRCHFGDPLGGGG